MNFADIPLLSILKGKLGYLSQRQSVIAQNVANADTPGYVPRDLTAFSFDKIMSGDFGSGLFPAGAASGAPTTGPSVIAPVRTNAMHIAADPGSAAASAYPNQIKEDSEVRLDGNHVVLEDQMVKLSGARMDYDAAVGFYQKSLALLTTALKRPGT